MISTLLIIATPLTLMPIFLLLIIEKAKTNMLKIKKATRLLAEQPKIIILECSNMRYSESHIDSLPLISITSIH